MQIGTFFLIIVAVLFWRVQSLQGLLRKENTGPVDFRQRGVGYEPAPNYEEAYPPMATNRATVPVEADSARQIHEMPSHDGKQELPSHDWKQELPGHQRKLELH
jgi:hypothetical protein